MVVDGKLGQGGEVDPDALVSGDEVGEFRIQGMETFHQDGLSLPQADGLFVPFLFAGDEIEPGQADFSSFQQGGNGVFERVRSRASRFSQFSFPISSRFRK